MNRKQQKAIVRTMCNDLKSTMLQRLDLANPPLPWDGIELRLWLAHLAQELYVVDVPAGRLAAYRKIRRERDA